MAIAQSLEPFAPAPNRARLNAFAPPKRADGVRIGLFNVKFSSNLGDGLLSECLEAELSVRLPGVTIINLDLAGRTRYSRGHNSRASALAALHYSPQSLRHALAVTVLGRKLRTDLAVRWRAALRELDAVVVGGGNLLSDSDLNFPLKLDAALTETRAAGVPTAVFAVGVSDNWSPRGQALFARALSETPLLYTAVRDDRSADVWRRRLESVGLNRPQVVHDPALLAAVHFPPRRRGERAAPVVGLGITHPVALAYHANDRGASSRDFSDWFVALAAACLAKGWRVEAFTNGSAEDEAFLARLAPRFATLSERGSISVTPRFVDPRALVAFISGLDLVMAHRLHANIAAYSYGIPQIGFTWDVKLKSFLEQVDRAACIATVGRDSVDEVVDLSARQLDAGVDPARHDAVISETRANVGALADALQSAISQDDPSVREAPPRRAATAMRRPDRLVIVNDFSIARGGATTLGLLEAELFARRGAPVSFIAGDAGENPDLDRHGVEVVTVGQRRLLEEGLPLAAFRGLYNRGALATLTEWITRNDTPGTVYHLHVWSQVLSPSVFTALAAVRERMLITARFLPRLPQWGLCKLFVRQDMLADATQRPLPCDCLRQTQLRP
jgi:polysaccharide pyruvyl transferase WcaK-like protein